MLSSNWELIYFSVASRIGLPPNRIVEIRIRIKDFKFNNLLENIVSLIYLPTKSTKDPKCLGLKFSICYYSLSLVVLISCFSGAIFRLKIITYPYIKFSSGSTIGGNIGKVRFESHIINGPPG